MKQSNIFLAATSCLLTIVGIAAKTYRNPVAIGWYQKGNSLCRLSCQIGGFTIAGRSTNNIVRTTAGTGIQQYTCFSRTSATTICIHNPLFTMGE